MMQQAHKSLAYRWLAAFLSVFFGIWGAPVAQGYSFNQTVPDVRQSVNLSGGSACPVRAHNLTSPGAIAIRWSTVLSMNPSTILTQDQTPTRWTFGR